MFNHAFEGFQMKEVLILKEIFSHIFSHILSSFGLHSINFPSKNPIISQ
jgi:hypothetical protein